jgi:hypothetical protein
MWTIVNLESKLIKFAPVFSYYLHTTYPKPSPPSFPHPVPKQYAVRLI